MNVMDIILATFIVFGLYKGLRNGLFIELASLVSFFVGVYIAIKFSYLMVAYFPSTWSSKTIKLVAFISTLLLIMIGLYQLAKVLSKIANFAYLGWLNTLGGALFGSLKTILFIGIVLGMIQKINFNNLIISKKTQTDSLLFDPILSTTTTLVPVLTNWLSDLKNDVSADLTN